MLIVKLGGSLYNTAELTHWLDVLAIQSRNQPIIIVPGGGPFAEQVREAQHHHYIDDAHAHHMALLAMAQFGVLIKALQPVCQSYIHTSDNNILFHPLSVWLPDHDLISRGDIRQSWDITSDSLALWLGQQLGGQLVIIKRCAITSASISRLTQTKILDDGFEAMYRQNPITVRLIHYLDYDQFKLNTNIGMLLS